MCRIPEIDQMLQRDDVQLKRCECLTQVSDTQADSGETCSVKTTQGRERSLSEIYDICNVSMIEPKSFIDTATDIAWKKSMNAAIDMIEKNKTWELVNRP